MLAECLLGSCLGSYNLKQREVQKNLVPAFSFDRRDEIFLHFLLLEIVRT